ncbi:MAG: Prefoldin subunit alpha [Candidatus Methanofastidiosum methylothiophilum]|jgi:prefoldin alpha subunit|uniref:Prefoldin subunit alpha n=1 Tax=Candidatus Methanofastidiosum methylothiophilum TaxID=1705564 RepID=A0A150JAL7_9EURY|nr:MAG: Prefoldin subunit alpha [Candidatus Methanofastidiosum methylthiophilus]OQC51721.1 MAG: Prefoldin subunit alpha [Euryarchaeota archaeon ADurb.Bin023]HNV94171.1 prefoldin subunit alpha [Methanofastidiosum sp.]KYC56032.1 MAG: Prefoldin subunit alpha [Candidatus Methanofastidiosum methylthiophilus]KYC56918.1 MAG: Prefoldin subunit alpha [Candidatus Methanofastidiosum methylthiophilus]
MAGEEEALRKLSSELNYLNDQSNLISNNLSLLSSHRNELAISKITLEGLKDIKPGNEILIPIGAGNFVKGTITDVGTVITTLARDVTMEKTIDETITKLDETLKEVEKNLGQNEATLQNIRARMNEIEMKAEEIMQKQK